MPEPNTLHPVRPRLAVALSGGGFRAALFHLGVLRRITEAGWLPRLDVISGVSGGSILAAFIVSRWPELSAVGLDPDGFERVVATPFRNLVARTNFLREWLLRLPALPFRKLVRPSLSRTNLAAERYDDMFFEAGGSMAGLPEHPTLILNASNLISERAFRFTQRGLGDSRIGYAPWGDRSLSIGAAVAASAAFPPVFAPVRVETRDYCFGGPVYEETVFAPTQHVPLTDGGVYDNLGIEALIKRTPLPGLPTGLLPAQFVLVSDAGYPPQHRFHPSRIPLFADAQLLYRVNTMALDAIGNQRRRSFIRDLLQATPPYSGALIVLGSSLDALDRVRPGLAKEYRDRIGSAHALPSEIVTLLQKVRTSLDAFTPTEAEALAYFGYQLTDAVLWAHSTGNPEPYRLDDALATWQLESTSERVRLWMEGLADSGRVNCRSPE